MARVWRLQNQLYDLASIEIASDKVWIGLVFFEGHDRKVVGFHNGVADGGNAFEEILRILLGGSWEGLDKDDLGRGL